ncbi:MAG TPA: protein-L-isoaspartate(D-aspartate) O-methyltransferase [Opitutaceae bacterium]|nr:protein-L-isoaspartate(D-aspartate) O-methyltransferase [Opitutaceae bacterium]
MKRHLRLEEVSNPAVLRAMHTVRREEFVSAALRSAAYDDRALPIPCGQTISQPAVVAYMTEQLRLERTDRVLEVGTGSGYQAAVLAEVVSRVYTIERIPALAEAAGARLARLGYRNVEVRTGDGTRGWPEAAPFDAIMVTAAAADIPPALVAQLAVGGRLIMPVGDPEGAQVLMLVERPPRGELVWRELWPVRFVPLLPT